MNFWDILGSIFNRPPEFEHLEKYMDVESERRVDPRRDAAIAVAISSITLGALAGAGMWFWLGSSLLAAGAVVAGLMFGASWVYRYQSRLTGEQREFVRSRSAAREFLEQLAQLRKRRQLKSKLGLATGEMLNSAAAYWLRAHVALQSDSWGMLSPESNWAQVRDRATIAMDSGMSKALILAKEAQLAGTEFFSPQLEAMKPVIEQMRSLSKECERLTDRLVIEAADSLGSRPADQLRETLADIQRLETAEQELGEVRRISLE